MDRPETVSKPYTIAAKYAKTETVIQRSRFIGECFPVETEEEAARLLAEAKSEYWDASHHCFAYSIGPTGAYSRFSDDGEPSGTAGLPMMEAIRYAGVTNVLCVVTRYFGGILLGTGGLVKAYSGSCRSALEAAGKLCMTPGVSYSFTVPYTLYSTFTKTAEKYAVTDATEFLQDITVTLHLPLEKEEKFLAEMTDRSNGRLSGIRGEEKYYPFTAGL